MRGLFEVFWLELTSIIRSWTLTLLVSATAVWMLVFPHVVRCDGTVEGAREIYIRYSLGAVFVLLVVSLVASASGALAKERTAKRLQLTLIRPVSPFAIALGKIAAYAMTGSLVLAVAIFLLVCKTDFSVRCNHVLSPILPSPQEEAKVMYESYMASPDTPDEVKKAKKAVVLRLLAQKAIDHYQTIPTNSTVVWRFPSDFRGETSPAVRMRFTNQFEMRQDLRGTFRLGGWEGVVSNITQAVLTVPLHWKGDPATASNDLSFENRGENSLMLRPRRDLNLLVPADGMGMNLFRAWLGMSAVLTLVIAFGLLLSAALSRPVALFVAIVTLTVSEMSPSVIEQYPDSLETNLGDRIGLTLTRFAAKATTPVSSLSPLEALSKDECVEWGEVVRILAADMISIPLLLALLCAFAMPRKQDDLM